MISAEALYHAGRFDSARIAYRKIIARHPDDYQATTHLGYIALFSNRLAEAKSWLTRAIALNPRDSGPRYALAQALYRGDDFHEAATVLAKIRTVDQMTADNYSSMYLPKLAGFGKTAPNVISGRGQVTRLNFIKLDPLPVVRLRVNGRSALFFLDTGGGETVIDPAFARELKVQQFGSVQGTFSGSKAAPVGNGRIASLSLGDFTMKNVPVQILGTRQFSAPFGVKQLDGILGTVVFYHFVATMDYAKRELVLQRKGSGNGGHLSSGKAISVPFWMAGDHFMIAHGRVNALPEMLFFVDTGIAGAGAKLTQAVIARAGIHLDEQKATQGGGAGGTIRTVPYRIPRLALGEFVRTNVPGVYDGQLPIATKLGFDVPGMIGHDAFVGHSITFDFSSMRITIR